MTQPVPEPIEDDLVGEVVPFRRPDEPVPIEDQGDDAALVIPVDPPVEVRGEVVYHQGQAERRPIIAPWLRDRDQRRQAYRWLVLSTAHRSGYHSARVPLYVSRLAVCTPRGVGRILAGVYRWTADTDSAPLRRRAIDSGDTGAHLVLSRQHSERVKSRAMLVAGTTVVTGAGLVVGGILLPGVLPVAGLVAAGIAGWAGRPQDRPMISPAVVSPRVERLTSEIVVRALTCIGLAAMSDKRGKITFPAPITRDGPGWRADVELPYGVTVADVMERRDRLASGLRRPLGCVWPEPMPDAHEGRLVLWVGDQDMKRARQPAWPLLKQGQVDLFRPVPFAVDQRGRPVALDLMFANVLIGAMPRMGKTFALRVLLLAAMLDPRAQLDVFELKGTGDLSSSEKVAHSYGSGADDDTLARCLDAVRDAYNDLDVRAHTIRSLPKHLVPENKVTPELANRRELGLYPRVLVISECQELFSHPDLKDDADRMVTALVKRGPALGILVLLDTQRPDAKSLPTGVSANVGIRFCLRVMDQTANDMVLGTSMYKTGYRATTFTARDTGIGYLVGATDNPAIVRSYYIDGTTAERIADRARAARERAGTLAGHAVGAPAGPVVNVLDDVLVVMSEEKLWVETIAERLAALRPEVYGGWTRDQVAPALKPYGVRTQDVWLNGTTKRGVVRAELVKLTR